MKRNTVLIAAILLLPVAAIQSAVLTLSSPLDYEVVQRTTKDKGTVHITIVSAVPSVDAWAFEARIISGGTTGQWQRLETRVSGAIHTAEMPVPAGGWYRLEVRLVKVKGKEVLAEGVVEHVGVGEVFVVAGQSNSANFGGEKQATKTGLVSAFDGKRWQLANDPQPGAGGGGGSFMPPFGDMIAERFRVPVGIVARGAGGTSVRHWLPKGTRVPVPPTGATSQLPGGEWESSGGLFNGLTERMKLLGTNGFRAVLWHQGESDAKQKDPTRTLPGNLYRQYMEQVIKESCREIGWNVPWFVAQASYHTPDDTGTEEIRAAQKSLWDAGIALEGPDTDKLTGDMRVGVHFSGKGLREHAARWVEKVEPWLEKQTGDRASGKKLPVPGEVFLVDGHQAFIIAPEKAKVSGPVPWVWYAPTLPGLPSAAESWMFEQFLAAGIAIVGIDVGESYGSPDGRKLFSALYRELTGKRGFAAKPVLMGRSRGGLMTLCWAAENADKVAGFAGIYPVCNIASYPGIAKACGAYHMTADELKAKLGEHNPIDRLEPLAKAKVPLLAIHGDVDKLVPLDVNSGEIKKRYDALGGEMQLIIPPGQGHNMWTGFFQCRELVDFVVRNATKVSSDSR